MTLYADIHEPPEIVQSLLPTKVNIDVSSYNEQGFADYHWDTCNGVLKNVERKTWGEILSNVDAVEEQLQRHLNNHKNAETVLLIEGAILKDGDSVTTIRPTSKGQVWVRGHRFKSRPLAGIYAWVYGISKYVEVIQTFNLLETATALLAMYEYDQKPEHETLQRPIKKNIYHPNPQVSALMGVSSGMGAKRASSLIEKYTTVWNIISAGFHGEPRIKDWRELTSIDGIGEKGIQRLLRNIGRTDV